MAAARKSVPGSPLMAQAAGGDPMATSATDWQSMSYSELLGALRQDLQLDLSTDVLTKSLPQDQLAPQRPAIVQNASDVLTSSVGAILASWTVAVGNQYTVASAAGIKIATAGVYLLTSGAREVAHPGELFTGITVNGALLLGDFFSGGAAGADGFSASQPILLTAAGGEVVSIEAFQNSGANYALAHSYLQAYLLGPRS